MGVGVGVGVAVAVGVGVTSWFLIVVSFAALLVVVGKREAELRTYYPYYPHSYAPIIIRRGDGRRMILIP